MDLNACCSSIHKTRKIQPLDAVIPQSEIGSLYDSISPVYDLWGKRTESKARARGLQLACIEDGSTVLEAAVGTGLAFEQIVASNPNGTNIGVDLSEGMLARARKRLSRLGSNNYSLRWGSASALEFESKSVDVLINNYMFDLISFQEMNRVIEEFKRVLKPQGRLVLVNMTKGRGMGSRMYDRIYRLFPKAMGGCRGVALSERLRLHGFRIETREYVRQMLFPSEVILAHNDVLEV